MTKNLRALGLSFVLGCAAAFPAMPAFAQVPVIVVSGSGTPLVNGGNLWNALAAVRSPYGLIQLEPGIYDLGTLSLVMRDGVDIAGAGRDNTTIRSTVGGIPIVFNAGVRAELRDVRIENHSTNFANQPAISISSHGAMLSRVDASIDLGFQGVGIIIDQASPRLKDVNIYVQPRVNDSVSGLFVAGGAPTIENLKVFFRPGGNTGIQRGVVLADSAASIDTLTIAGATDLRGYSIGVSVERLTPSLVESPVLVKIRDADVKVHTSGLGEQAYAFKAAYHRLELRDSKGEASTSNELSRAAGLSVTDNAHVTIYGSTLRGIGNGGYGITSGCPTDTSSPTVLVHHSVSEGTTNAYEEQDGSISFGASQLLGARPGNAICANSYDGAFTVLNGPC